MIEQLALVFAMLTAILSVVAFVAIGIDKRRARRGAWRTRESTLHLLELLGGWPGAMAARWLFRHKTRDVKYRLIAGAIAVGHLLVWAAVVWLMWVDK